MTLRYIVHTKVMVLYDSTNTVLNGIHDIYSQFDDTLL